VSPSSARSPLGAIGVFEREMMLERQRDRIAKAKGDGNAPSKTSRTGQTAVLRSRSPGKHG
jgi:hypothetical protein